MHLAILSRNANLYSTKRLVQAAEQRGHRVTVIDVLKCNLLMEKRNPGIYYQNGYVTDVDGVIPRIGASVTFYGTAVVRQFEMKKVFSAVESQALVRSRDKLRSLQILSRAGLGLPKTVFTGSRAIMRSGGELEFMAHQDRFESHQAWPHHRRAL